MIPTFKERDNVEPPTFFPNNLLTSRDRRLRGFALLPGLLTFYAVCSIGAIANVGVAGFVFERDYSWWVSGVAGVLVGTICNYAMTSLFTWGPRRSG